ncbi:MAG: PorV/PorQ family protein [Candidatus Anstonellales archaeon]
MNKKNIWLVLCLVVAINLYSAVNQNVGTTSSMFKVLLSPKVVSLGGAYSVFSDIDSISVNPAGIGSINTKQISLAYTSWLVQTNYSYLAFGLPLGKVGSLGLLINYFSAGSIEETDINGPTGREFTASGLLTSLTYAKTLAEKFSLGISLKYISQTIDKDSASTPSLDIGSIFSLNEKIKFSLSLQNLFGSIKFVNQEDKLPTNIKIGGGVNIIDNLVSVVDINVPLDNNISFGAGVEYAMKFADFVFPIRVGYRSGNDALIGFALGLGFGYKDFVSLNLSWAPSISELNQNTLNVGLNLKF